MQGFSYLTEGAARRFYPMICWMYSDLAYSGGVALCVCGEGGGERRGGGVLPTLLMILCVEKGY